MADKTLLAQRAGVVDVRTNMLGLLLINTLVMTGKGGVFQMACVAVVCGLLLQQRRWRAAAILAFCIGALVMLPVIATLDGMPASVTMLLTALMFTRPYLIAGFMGYYFICATSPSLLIAGMNRLRVPQMVIIPLAVMLRFFPVIWEEQQAIRGAMRMRGLPGRGGVLLHPWRTLEYILIPLIGAAIRSGEAMSASALSRGLGNPVTPSSIVPLRFGGADLLLCLLYGGLVVLFFYCGSVW